MLTNLKSLLHRKYRPLNVIEISKNNLLSNYEYLSSINKQIRVAPVLKSNAYGHGLVLTAKILDELNPPFFCVDSLFEAYDLSNEKIKTPILVMGYIDPQSLQTKHLPYSFAIYTNEQLQVLNKYQPRSNVHLFIDTGMHREGVQIDNLNNFIKRIKKTSLNLEGVMSHFGMSENPDHKMTKIQNNNFKEAINILSGNNFNPRYIHFANSSGLLESTNYPYLGNVSRAGMALYGIDPTGKNDKLKPVLSFKTKIAQIKTIRKGEQIGYDFTFRAERKMQIAILPAGYNDGIDRRFSNKGFVRIKSKFCLIVGRVSMNITVVDISEISNAKPGDTVEIFSNLKLSLNSIEKQSRMANTIPYELMVHLNPLTKRVAVT